MYLATAFFILAVALTIIQALDRGMNARIPGATYSKARRMRMRGLTAFLYLLQPIARLWGHLSFDLLSRRRRRQTGFAFPRQHISSVWTEDAQAPEARLRAVEADLRSESAVVWRGSDHDSWDLEVRGGPLGSVRARMLVEDHGPNGQLVLFRAWPRVSLLQLSLIISITVLSLAGAFGQAWPAAAILSLLTVALTARMISDCSFAMGSLLAVLERSETRQG
jgi:hypothetical protein